MPEAHLRTGLDPLPASISRLKVGEEEFYDFLYGKWKVGAGEVLEM